MLGPKRSKGYPYRLNVVILNEIITHSNYSPFTLAYAVSCLSSFKRTEAIEIMCSSYLSASISTKCCNIEDPLNESTPHSIYILNKKRAFTHIHIFSNISANTYPMKIIFI